MILIQGLISQNLSFDFEAASIAAASIYAAKSFGTLEELCGYANRMCRASVRNRTFGQKAAIEFYRRFTTASLDACELDTIAMRAQSVDITLAIA
jgi:hypothetical protein